MPKGIFKRLTPEERFWRNIHKTDNCWQWKGNMFKSGYGRLYFNGSSGYRAHRFSYLLHKGEIPNGYIVCHSCDNPSCVNPDHLFLGTSKINTLDAKAKGRLRHSGYGEKHHHHKLTSSDIKQIKSLSSTLTRSQLARNFGVHPITIWRVLTNRTRLFG